MSATTVPGETPLPPLGETPAPPPPPPHSLPTGQFLRGVNWPGFTDDWETRLEALDNFEPREDDVFVVSFPKSGHHWSHDFLTMIIGGEAEPPKGTKGDVFLEFHDPKRFEANPSPRLILTHLQFPFLPKRILEKRCKIIRITRNPKDVCVSFYNHHRAIKMDNYSAPLSHYFGLFLEGANHYGSFFEFERRYAEELAVADRRDHVFHTSFEALKADPAAEIKACGEFLGLKRSDEFYRLVADKTSFEKAKAREHEFYKTFCNEGRSLYRKGQVGDWVNHLTVAQSRQIDAKVEEYQLNFRYEL